MIYYIGGSPCCGKSTIAEILAAKHGFHHFKLDDHLMEHMQRGVREGYEIFKRVTLMSTEDMWMREPAELCREEISIYEIMFSYAINDLTYLPKDKPIVAEGAGFLPQLMKEIFVNKSHYICIVPTRDFQINTYSKRPWIDQYLANCTDKDAAFNNWMQRDILFAETVLCQAKELDYHTLVVDGATGIDMNFSIVEKAFELDFC